MIQSFKIPLGSGQFLAISVLEKSELKSLCSRIAKNETVADNFIKKWEKETIRNVVSKFLNHREKVWDLSMNLRTTDNANIWTGLKRNFDFLESASLESNCKFILASRRAIEQIMPGPKSRFYESTTKTLAELFQFCEQKINK